jgi:hypothetical protein
MGKQVARPGDGEENGEVVDVCQEDTGQGKRAVGGWYIEVRAVSGAPLHKKAPNALRKGLVALQEGRSADTTSLGGNLVGDKTVRICEICASSCGEQLTAHLAPTLLGGEVQWCGTPLIRSVNSAAQCACLQEPRNHQVLSMIDCPVERIVTLLVAQCRVCACLQKSQNCEKVTVLGRASDWRKAELVLDIHVRTSPRQKQYRPYMPLQRCPVQRRVSCTKETSCHTP